ncbi:hypothetical protein PTKIN_Ptkin10aG0098100 [Pterospermum kingtungense]
MEGASVIKSDGILALTNNSMRLLRHAFYPSPLRFKKINANNRTEAVTFSTNFVFSITPKYPDIGGHGLAFVLMPTKKPNISFANQYLGLPNDTSNGRFLAVEFDIVQNLELPDINDNHVGIDISSLISNISEPAAYCSVDASGTNDNRNNSIVLKSGEPIQAWIDYDSKEMLMNVSISPLGMIGARAQDLDSRKLPFLKTRSNEVVYRKGFAVGMSLASITLVFLVIIGAIHIILRIRKGDENLEDWEIEYGAWRFKYSELFSTATGLQVAIKRVSNGPRQGMKEFVAEITSMGRLRHRNLVRLHGWCRKKDELLLVYDYFPNESLDKHLYEDGPLKRKILIWDQRYKILTGVAQALLYLHEECNQRVVHRDVKPSNVLLDEDLNAKLGDFGLARTYEHDINPQTTHIVGTLMLEVASRRKPIEPQKNAKELLLVDWVRELHSPGEITSH